MADRALLAGYPRYVGSAVARNNTANSSHEEIPLERFKQGLNVHTHTLEDTGYKPGNIFV